MTRHLAVLCEYIEKGDNVAGKMQETPDFLFNAGFCENMSAMTRNWKSLMLVDFSNLAHAGGDG